MAKILVVDDDPKMVELLSAVLEQRGHLIETISDGNAALERLGADSTRTTELPDVIVLDLVMPLLDGFTVAARLNANERTRQVPIVILTGKGEQMRHFFKDHPNVKAFLEKPVNVVEFVETIAGLTKRR
jgi:CheY-like chemotaxis protein